MLRIAITLIVFVLLSHSVVNGRVITAVKPQKIRHPVARKIIHVVKTIQQNNK